MPLIILLIVAVPFYQIFLIGQCQAYKILHPALLSVRCTVGWYGKRIYCSWNCHSRRWLSWISSRSGVSCLLIGSEAPSMVGD
jgi:hypothetical protein